MFRCPLGGGYKPFSLLINGLQDIVIKVSIEIVKTTLTITTMGYLNTKLKGFSFVQYKSKTLE